MSFSRYVLPSILIGASILYGQSATATLSGTVSDSSGAYAPGVSVSAAHTATGLKSSAVTNNDGGFTIPLLQPGKYTVTAEHPGFAVAEIKDVVLEVGDRVALQIKLTPGQVQESVTVTADAGQLQLKSESGERSQVITNKQVMDLALNGRNVLDLMKTLPGVVSNLNAQVYNEGGLDQFNINGTRGNEKQEMVDGTSNLIAGANNRTQVTINPDAIAELKILTSNYQAEYGKAGGGFIEYTTRSGGSRFHGGARWFGRNEDLNANNFFNNQIGQPRPLYRYNYYGFDIGGPVIIPGARFNHGRDKLFFFFNQEHYRQIVPDPRSSIQVPTAAERDGDFSHSTDGTGKAISIKDPVTGNPFPGNIIPKNRFFNNGQAILNIYPLPNDTTGGARYNYTSQGSDELPRIENIVRIDYNITEHVRLSGRFIYSPDQQIRTHGGAANVVTNYPLNALHQDQTPWNAAFNLTNIISPSMTNEFIFGPSRSFTHVYYAGPNAQKATYGINFPLFYQGLPGSDILPTFQFGGIANQTFPVGTIIPVSFSQHNPTYNVIDNLTKVAGSHTWKAGVFVQRSLQFNPLNQRTNAIIGFNNNANNPLNTGDPVANALLGIYDTYSQANKSLAASLLYWNVEPYVQDTWKVSKRLTLDYGMRISWIPPQYEEQNLPNGFSPSLYNPAKAVRLYTPVLVSGQRRAVDPANIPASLTATNTLPSSLIGVSVPGSGDPLNGIWQTSQGYYRGGFKSRGAQWGPRFGFAYDVGGKGKTVIRGGYGISYDRPQANVISNLAGNPPTVLQPTLYYGNLADLSSATGYNAPAAVTGYAPDGKLPNVQSFSIGVQRSIGWGTVLDVAYVGTLSRHLVDQINLNSIPYGTTFQRAAQDPTMYPNGVVPAVEPGLPAAYQQAGLSFMGDKALPAVFLSPYQGYAAVNYRSFSGTSNYSSLQVGVNRKLSKSLTFGAAYTWSKALTTTDADFEATDPNNTRGYDYRLAGFDRTHVFVVNYVYDVPKAARFAGGSLLAKLVLDDWQVSGISQYYSGTPYELGMAINGVNTGQTILGTYSFTPMLYRYGGAAGPSGGLQINPNAYYAPPIGSIGPYPRTTLRGPGFVNHDVSVFKNIPLGKESVRRLQLRLEMFNAFNNTEFSGINSATQLVTPGGAIGSAVFSSYPNVAITNNLRPAGSTAALGQFFGEYSGARDGRIIQLGVKVYF